MKRSECCAESEWSLWLYALPGVFANNPNEKNVRGRNERSVIQCNGGQLNEVGLQDTGSCREE